MFLFSCWRGIRVHRGQDAGKEEKIRWQNITGVDTIENRCLLFVHEQTARYMCPSHFLPPFPSCQTKTTLQKGGQLQKMCEREKAPLHEAVSFCGMRPGLAYIWGMIGALVQKTEDREVPQ